MSQVFEVNLSDSPIAQPWNQESAIAYHARGLTIHLVDLKDSARNLGKVQAAGRAVNKLKCESVKLCGEWSLEAQWHFWQGAFGPKRMPEIEFAALNETEQATLESRIHCLTWVRQTINLTPQELCPQSLASSAAEFIAELAPEQVTYQIISGEELESEGYVGIHGVGRGSTRPPALLVLDYCPEGLSDQAPAAALVGKGITFDSGGYSMKSSQGMLHMKSDMGGAATVAGALALAISQGLKQRVKLFLCCAENLVSGHAYKLSDILHYRNGVSVEVVNTDAEGRLVLADGLIDAANTNAPLVIDAATLTGAAVVAVGDDFNAMFCMDDELAENFSASATQENDLCWRLPLTAEHRNKCPSNYADTANSRSMPGGGSGAASNAAGFLSRFVTNPEKGWLHLDLAACYRATGNASWSAGATGRGVRSIAAYLRQL